MIYRNGWIGISTLNAAGFRFKFVKKKKNIKFPRLGVSTHSERVKVISIKFQLYGSIRSYEQNNRVVDRKIWKYKHYDLSSHQ